MKGLDGIRDGERDVDDILEEVVAARRTGNDPKELFGGPRDWIDSMAPPAALLIGNVVAGLKFALYAALAAEILVVGVRLVRRETLRHAFSGFFGVGIAALIAWKTGELKNYFVPGIITNIVYGVGFVLSVVFRKPIVGVIMRMVIDHPKSWHEHPVVRRAYAEVTLAWGGMFLVRFVVQESLRRADEVGWLTVARLSMGYPLFIAAMALTLPYVKWRARAVPVPESADTELGAQPGGEDTAEQTA